MTSYLSSACKNIYNFACNGTIEANEETITDIVYKEVLDSMTEVKNAIGEQEVVKECLKKFIRTQVRDSRDVMIEAVKDPKKFKEAFDELMAGASKLSKRFNTDANVGARPIPIPLQNMDESSSRLSTGSSNTNTPKIPPIEYFLSCADLSQIIEKFKKKKMSVRIVCVGRTQVGKSETIRNLIDVQDIPIGNGYESQTSVVKPYAHCVNGVEMIFVDTPGFYDSKGNSKQYDKDLKSYMSSNKINLILWFARLTDTLDECEQNSIQRMRMIMGENPWKHTIIVLTHANSGAPKKMVEDKSFELTGLRGMQGFRSLSKEAQEKLRKDAWYECRDLSMVKWREAFNRYGLYNEKKDIPIVLVENDNFSADTKLDGNGDTLLNDETPVWKTFIQTIFKTISTDAIPFTAAAVVGEYDENAAPTRNQRIIIDSLPIVKEAITTGFSSSPEPQPSSAPAPSSPGKKEESGSIFDYCTIL